MDTTDSSKFELGCFADVLNMLSEGQCWIKGDSYAVDQR